MSIKTKYKCDICGKEIKEGHQQYYMTKITVDWIETVNDGGICAEGRKDIYQVHNDFSNHCLRKIWEILEHAN